MLFLLALILFLSMGILRDICYMGIFHASRATKCSLYDLRLIALPAGSMNDHVISSPVTTSESEVL